MEKSKQPPRSEICTRNTRRLLVEEVVWNARFADIFNCYTDDGLLTIGVRKLHSIELFNPDERRSG
jgi:hypothetical protein